MNIVLYTTLVRGFARMDKVEDATRIYSLMIMDQSALTYLATFSILLKANCDSGELEVSLEMLGTLLEIGLLADEVICSNLLARFGETIHLFSQCKMLGEAVGLLAKDAPSDSSNVASELSKYVAQ